MEGIKSIKCHCSNTKSSPQSFDQCFTDKWYSSYQISNNCGSPKTHCPQGRTYPKKAVKIANKKIMFPTNHTFFNLYLLKKRPRKIWIYINKKNIEAPLAWTKRINHPSFTSRIMKSTFIKASELGA